MVPSAGKPNHYAQRASVLGSKLRLGSPRQKKSLRHSKRERVFSRISERARKPVVHVKLSLNLFPNRAGRSDETRLPKWMIGGGAKEEPERKGKWQCKLFSAVRASVPHTLDPPPRENHTYVTSCGRAWLAVPLSHSLLLTLLHAGKNDRIVSP